MKRKCIELTKVFDGVVKTAQEANVIDVSEAVKALPDSANKQKVKVKPSQRNRNCLGQTDREPSTSAVGK